MPRSSSCDVIASLRECGLLRGTGTRAEFCPPGSVVLGQAPKIFTELLAPESRPCPHAEAVRTNLPSFNDQPSVYLFLTVGPELPHESGAVFRILMANWF